MKSGTTWKTTIRFTIQNGSPRNLPVRHCVLQNTVERGCKRNQSLQLHEQSYPQLLIYANSVRLTSEPVSIMWVG
jgi:hypothetical protein